MDRCIKILNECINDDLFLHPVFSDDRKHPVICEFALLFIYNFKTKKIYHLNFTHQDESVKTTFLETLKFLFELRGKLFVLNKKSFLQHFPVTKILDVNLGLHLSGDNIIDVEEFRTEAHRYVYASRGEFNNLNEVIPLVKHLEMFGKIVSKINKENKNAIYDEEYYNKINSEILEALCETEYNGIYVDKNKFEKRFGTISEEYVYSQYNIYTATGRPSNRFGGINYAALNKEDGSRECFISRFNKEGTMVLVDYSAFHPRIIGKMMNFKLPDDEDFYKYIAKLYFKKTLIDNKEVINAKQLTFRQLYGGVEDQYHTVPYFYNLKKLTDEYWESFTKSGFVRTPIFSRKIYNNQITEPTPSKLFNYILQATETEIAVQVLGRVNAFLRAKKSKAVLYTYDSVLFDVHIGELNLIKKEVIDMMRMDGKFPIKCYLGESYADMKQITV